MAHLDRKADRLIARIATRSHGVVTRRQLLAAGVTREEIRHRLAAGALLREHRGVYRAGHRAPSPEATYLAAVLACGDRAVLAGEAAADLLELTRGQPPRPEVVAPTERRIPGVATHRSVLHLLDATVYRGVPVTTPARTLVDLAAVLGGEALARACHEAGVRHGTTPDDVEDALGRRPTASGAARLRAVLHGEAPVTLSRLELRFIALLRAARLPLPVTNRPAGGRHVDCRRPDLRLTVELDGYRYHRSRHAWERDRRREREARARGDDFRRFTYGDVLDDPDPLLAELRVALRPSIPG